MLFLPKFLRPVGNRVSLKSRPLEIQQFLPFSVRFYQSGTASLTAAIIASIKVRQQLAGQPEVIMPAYSCPDIISATLGAGAKPVLVDFEADLPWMSLPQIEDSINDNTVAVIAINFLGIPERIDQLKRILKTREIILIEDSAQGFPLEDAADYWQGDINIVSFGRGKPVNLLGGGAVFCQREDLINALPEPSSEQSGIVDECKYLLKLLIYNVTINPFIYAFLVRIPGLKIGQTLFKSPQTIRHIASVNLSRLAANLELYRDTNDSPKIINQQLQTLGLADLIDLPATTKFDFTKPLLRYPLLLRNAAQRNKFYADNRALGLSLMYRKALNKISGVDEITGKNQHFPNAENFASRLVTMPTHGDISEADISQLTKSLLARSNESTI